MGGGADAEGAEPGSAAWWAQRRATDAKRRPRADGLTTARIVEAAMDIVDREGLDALTVRRLADRFGTSSGSLYRHIDSREELVVLIIDHALGGVDLTPDPRGWRASSEAILTSLRAATMRHPRFLPAVQSFPLRGPNALRVIDGVLAVFLGAGLGPAQATYASTACLNYVFGASALLSGPAGLRPPSAPILMDAQEAARVYPPDSHPALQEAEGEFATLTADDLFPNGLAIVLDGIAARFGRSSD